MVKQYAIALSGGGFKIGYEVGALTKLHEIGIIPSYITGTSAGALVAGYLAQAHNSQEYKIRLFELTDLIMNLKQTDIFTAPNDVFAKIYQLVKFGGLYNTLPLYELICDKVNPNEIMNNNFIRFEVGAVDLESGIYATVSNNSLRVQIHEGIYSSCIQPIFMIMGNPWADGGVRHITPLGNAYDYIRLFPQPLDWRIICIVPHSKYPKNWKFKRNLISIASRTLEILLNEINENDLKLAEAYDLTRMCVPRYIIRPDVPLNINPLQFNKARMKEAFNQGYDDALSFIKNHPAILE